MGLRFNHFNFHTISNEQSFRFDSNYILNNKSESLKDYYKFDDLFEIVDRKVKSPISVSIR